jgi:hypothetical protein
VEGNGMNSLNSRLFWAGIKNIIENKPYVLTEDKFTKEKQNFHRNELQMG